MPGQPVQQLLPFDQITVEAVSPPLASADRYRPSEEAVDAMGRLLAWLSDPRTGRMTPVAEEALFSVRKALVEGKGSYHHQAEDLLEALKLRNAPTEGDDIPAGVKAVCGGDFHQAVEDLLDCLHERLMARGGGRSA